MPFIEVLQQPPYGWKNDKGELIKPSLKQLYAEAFSRINVFADRKNWITLMSWLMAICMLPLFFVFIYSIKRNEGFFIGAGTSIAYGISGRDKVKFGVGMPDENKKVKFGSGAGEVKSFDFGANAIAGYKFKGGFMVSEIIL